MKKIYLILLLLIGSIRIQAQVPVTEYNALMSIYNNTSGASWINNNNWGNGDLKLIGWAGVSVTSGHVSTISLSVNGLQGTLPDVFADLPFLETIWLSNNSFSAGSTIPATIWGLASLKSLKMSVCNLSGTLPNAIGSLPSIADIDLSGNNLSGAIPTSIVGIKNTLNSLNFGKNSFSGSIPSGIGEFKQLKNLNLGSNQLSGTLPTDMSLMTVLTQFIVNGNRLSGTLPVSITTLTGLTTFNISFNDFTDIPSAFLSWSPSGTVSTNITNNKFDFDDIANILPNPKVSLTYAIMKPLQPFESTKKYIGDNLSINAPIIGGTGNVYEWQIDFAVQGNTTNVFTTSNITVANKGYYQCFIKNPNAPDLTILAVDLNIDVFLALKGKVKKQDNTVVEIGKVRLYEKAAIGLPYTYIDEVQIIGREYLFELSDPVLPTQYLIIATPDATAYPDVIPSYYGGTIFWKDATVIATNVSILSLDVVVAARPAPTKELFTILGNVEGEDGLSPDVYNQREKVKGSRVTLTQSSSDARGTKKKVVAYVVSDANGQFEFPKLPRGIYQINVDIAGIPMDTVSATLNLIQKDNINLTALVKTDKIVIIINEATATNDEVFVKTVQIYPNPATDELKVTLANTNTATNAFVVNELGQTVWEGILEPEGATISLQGFRKGNYILCLKTSKDASIKTSKFMIR